MDFSRCSLGGTIIQPLPHLSTCQPLPFGASRAPTHIPLILPAFLGPELPSRGACPAALWRGCCLCPLLSQGVCLVTPMFPNLAQCQHRVSGQLHWWGEHRDLIRIPWAPSSYPGPQAFLPGPRGDSSCLSHLNRVGITGL